MVLLIIHSFVSSFLICLVCLAWLYFACFNFLRSIQIYKQTLHNSIRSIFIFYFHFHSIISCMFEGTNGGARVHKCIMSIYANPYAIHTHTFLFVSRILHTEHHERKKKRSKKNPNHFYVDWKEISCRKLVFEFQFHSLCQWKIGKFPSTFGKWLHQKNWLFLKCNCISFLSISTQKPVSRWISKNGNESMLLLIVFLYDLVSYATWVITCITCSETSVCSTLLFRFNFDFDFNSILMVLVTQYAFHCCNVFFSTPFPFSYHFFNGSMQRIKQKYARNRSVRFN